MTMLRNFDFDTTDAKRAVLITEVPEVEQVLVAHTPRAHTAKTHLLTTDWSWQEMRDYVVGEIEARFGVFPRVEYKEKAIFSAFIERWGAQAQPIVRYAFETCDGVWRGAPISVTRFCVASDPYFAKVINDLLG